MRRRAALLCGLLLVSGCGVNNTEVINMGDPARGVRMSQGSPSTSLPRPSSASTLVYLVSNGIALPVRRPGQGGADASLSALLSEPLSDTERKDGFSSQVPLRTAAAFDSRTKTVKLNGSPANADLSDLAIQQIVCTALQTDNTGDRGPAVIVFNGQTVVQRTCRGS
ncbi:hypothetical protein D5S17_00410 [Pseudonocardiaceae bacterium YIM PH 21723]|nr:hypothetical protein D5S17_00410 [Pseudonocardiaceae bacterium YIM PH 21723]